MQTVVLALTKEELLAVISVRVKAIRKMRGITDDKLAESSGQSGSSCDDCVERNQVADMLVTNKETAQPWTEMHIWSHSDLVFIANSLLRWQKEPEETVPSR